MKIPMPSPDEKRRSIEAILQSVPETPASFRKTAGDMLRLLGFRGLFFGVGDAAFIALMSAGFLGAFVFGMATPGGAWNGILYGVLFLFSPLTYMLLHSLTSWKERITGVWELGNTYRFTPRHLAAVRMLCFGGAGTVLCAALSLLLSLYSDTAFLRLFGVTLCSLFLFAAVFMLLLLKLRETIAQTACIGLWCILAIAFNTDMGAVFMDIFNGLPLVVLFITAASLLFAFILEIRAYFLQKGENGYVVG